MKELQNIKTNVDYLLAISKMKKFEEIIQIIY